MSPPSLDSKASVPPNASVCSPTAATGQKRPATNSPPNPREATGFKQPATQGKSTKLFIFYLSSNSWVKDGYGAMKISLKIKLNPI